MNFELRLNYLDAMISRRVLDRTVSSEPRGREVGGAWVTVGHV